MSGIFRDVFLLERSARGLKDFFIARTALKDDYAGADVVPEWSWSGTATRRWNIACTTPWA